MTARAKIKRILTALRTADTPGPARLWLSKIDGPDHGAWSLLNAACYDEEIWQALLLRRAEIAWIGDFIADPDCVCGGYGTIGCIPCSQCRPVACRKARWGTSKDHLCTNSKKIDGRTCLCALAALHPGDHEGDGQRWPQIKESSQ